MDNILNFILTQPSWTIIIILVVLLFVKDIGIKNIFRVLGLIRGIQKDKGVEVSDNHLELMSELHKQNQILAQQNEKFATNHALHEIPDIRASVGRIEKTLEGVVEIQTQQGKDIAVLLDFKSNSRK